MREWDDEIRKHLSEDSFWFAPLSPETGTFDANITRVGEHRNQRVIKDLKDWLSRVGLPYHSPHKFRHGHAVFSIKLAKDVPEFKAISQI